MINQRLDVPIDRPVDGDTVRIIINGKSESVRIQALDTEESKAGGDKPQTPWARKQPLTPQSPSPRGARPIGPTASPRAY